MSLGAIGTPPFCTAIGPVSTPASGRNTVTPDSVAPSRICQASALPPRKRGKSDGWKHSERVRRPVDDLGRQDHRDEREHVELGAELAVLLDELGDRGALAPEARVAEQRQAALLGLRGERIGARARRRRIHADHVVARLEQTHECVATERGLTEQRDAQRHGGKLARQPAEPSSAAARTAARLWTGGKTEVRACQLRPGGRAQSSPGISRGSSSPWRLQPTESTQAPRPRDGALCPAAPSALRATRRTIDPTRRDRSGKHARACARPSLHAGAHSGARRRSHCAPRAACAAGARGSDRRARARSARRRDSRLGEPEPSAFMPRPSASRPSASTIRCAWLPWSE